MLIFGARRGYDLSRIILLLQIPCIVLSGIPLLGVAIAFNLYLTAVWLGRNGTGPTILGFNALAIFVFVVFLWAKPAISGEFARDFQDPPAPPKFQS